MSFGVEAIIYIGIFIGVILLVEGLYLTVFGKSISLNSRVNRRLEMMDKGAQRQEVLEQLRKEMSQHISGTSIPLYSILANRAQRANIAFSPQQLVTIMIGVTVFVFFGLSFGTEAALPVRAIVALCTGIGGVYMWVNNKAKKRSAMLEEQLPDAIDLMVRSLKVGHPFSSAIGSVAEEVQDPLGTEFGFIADEAAYGGDITEALKELAERMDSQDLRFLAVAVGIQQKSGGNLAEILAGLGYVIRSRFKLFRRVKAITSEAKFSGMFLSGFPIAAALAVNVVVPDYYDEVKTTSAFIPAVIIVAILLVVNIIFMRMMVNIKV